MLRNGTALYALELKRARSLALLRSYPIINQERSIGIKNQASPGPLKAYIQFNYHSTTQIVLYKCILRPQKFTTGWYLPQAQ
ncbi:MAG: hypothetical protein AAGU04_00410 [Anaerolineaceae bacterium]